MTRTKVGAGRPMLLLDRTIEVRVLGVVEPPHFPTSAPVSLHPVLRATVNDIVKERSEDLERALAAMAAPLHGKVSVVAGRPGDAIVAEAAAGAADLVVVGARGLGHMSRVLLGSVSERVLRHAECPVLIVKRPSR